MDGVYDQDNLVLCKDTINKGITTMLLREKTASKLLLGSGKLPLWIIIKDRVPKCVVHEMADVRGSTKGKFIKKNHPQCVY